MNGQAVEVYGRLETLDYVIIGVYLALSIGIGLSFMRRGTKDMREYFIGGGSMPWWLVGISLLATAFAADTPQWIGGMIYDRGIEGAWLYWANGIGAAFWILVIAPLWKRCSIVTDPEFFEVRFAGGAASFLRLFNGIYTAAFVNLMMMAVGILSIAKIMQVTTGLEKLQCVVITVSGALIYSALSGIWGVCATDFMQFFVTVIGSFILAFYALHAAGGSEAVVDQIHSMSEWSGSDLNVFPRFGKYGGLTMCTIIFLFGLKWLEYTGMGGFVAQRLFASKSAKQAVFTGMIGYGLYFSIIPLPWIITIVCSKIVMPGITDGQEAYPRMAMGILPVGLKGVLIASMLAAFMSTFSSLLNWGSSYFINDFYRRFCVKNASPKHYVRVGQLAMLPMAAIAAFIAFRSEKIINLLFIPLAAGVGGTLIALLRWMWWRINAWTMVAATVGSPIFFALVYPLFPSWVHPDTMEKYYGERMLFILACTTVTCLVVTFLTKPVREDVLDAFYRKVRPPGFWGPVKKRVGVKSDFDFWSIAYGWAVLLMAIYGPLVGCLKLFFGQPLLGCALIGVGILGFILAVKHSNNKILD